MKIKIKDIEAFRIALTCAALNDVRQYLEGVYFNRDTGEMVATDGHRLALASDAFWMSGPNSCKVNMRDRSIPKKTAMIEIDSRSLTATYLDESHSRIKIIPVEMEKDPKFCDYQKLIESKPKEPELQPLLGINPKFIADFSKVMPKGCGGITMLFRGAREAVDVLFEGKKNIHALIMPMRTEYMREIGL